jgi:hypothetical protein
VTIHIEDEKDTLLSVLKNDKNHLLVKELLLELRQEKLKNHEQDLLYQKELKINYF